MRIGILGGVFDPIHKGHLALARAAAAQLNLGLLYFVPVAKHPLETKKSNTAPSKARLEMIQLETKTDSRFKVSDCELRRGGFSYTVDTIRFFRKQYPAPHELFFITGGDWGKRLQDWKDIDQIFSMVHFVVAKRPGFETQNLPEEVEFLDFKPLDVSSTQIRGHIRQGKSIQRLVSPDVIEYIQQHQLYV